MNSTGARCGGSDRGALARSAPSSWPCCANQSSIGAAPRADRGRRSGAAGAANPVGRQGKPERDAAAGLRHRHAQRRSRPAVFPRHRAGTGAGFGDRRDCAAKSAAAASAAGRSHLAGDDRAAAGGAESGPAPGRCRAGGRRRWRRRPAGETADKPPVEATVAGSRQPGDESPPVANRAGFECAGGRAAPATPPPLMACEIDDGAARCGGRKTDRTREAGESRRRGADAGGGCVGFARGRGRSRCAASGIAQASRSSEPNSGSMSAARIRSAACARCGAGLLKSRSNAALATLRPIIVIKESNNGLGMQLRLVAGPLSDAAAAAKICAALIENERACETRCSTVSALP